ncbi:unnamed protein product [Larinioides sclopetarius]|uniref:Secreted protein n=1 Tax=Larinioides sclopetarius TaxID=280406 RepID=A0AAV2BTI8_9ARAC
MLSFLLSYRIDLITVGCYPVWQGTWTLCAYRLHGCKFWTSSNTDGKYTKRHAVARCSFPVRCSCYVAFKIRMSNA